MDEQRFLNACRLREDRNFAQAYNEFIWLAESSVDPLDKAGALLHAANTLEMSGKTEAAATELSAARALIEQYRPARSQGDEKFAAVELFLDYEDANLAWLRGENLQATISRFEAVTKKHSLESASNKDSRKPKNLYSRNFYESIQIRRAFILADLGRWEVALPILEEIKSPQEYEEGVAYYLGHCYLAAHDYIRAEQKLTEALRLGNLPTSLQYRAHCELGMTYYNLRDYTKARVRFLEGAQLADSAFIKEWEIWRWLELTCRALGLRTEAEQYARMANPS